MNDDEELFKKQVNEANEVSQDNERRGRSKIKRGRKKG